MILWLVWAVVIATGFLALSYVVVRLQRWVLEHSLREADRGADPPKEERNG